MGSMFRPKVQPSAPMPEPTPPAPMPDSSSEGVIEANRRAKERIMSRAGRSSTILSAPEGRGGAYSASKLGTDA